jgi:hypothetical protein
MRSHWLIPGSRDRSRRVQAGLTPRVENLDRRALMSSGLSHPSAIVDVQPTALKIQKEIARYPAFHGSLPTGHKRILTITGPILLGQTDARGQVIGAIYLPDGSRAGVVGLIFGNEVSLRISLPGGRVVHAGGTGTFRPVRGGVPGYDALIGGGSLSPATGPFVQGKWRTTKAVL